MGVCHIIGAGDFFSENFSYVGSKDMVIAADGGIRWLTNLNIDPHYIVGDFDSYPENEAMQKNLTIIRLEQEKDETDMLRAIRLGQSKGFNIFHLHGGTGGRPDHTFANIQNIVNLSKNAQKGFLFFKDYYMTAITNSSIEIKGTQGEYISVFSYGGKTSGVFLSGVKYSLNDATLADDNPIGTSNEFTFKTAKITATNGTLLITCPTSAKIK